MRKSMGTRTGKGALGIGIAAFALAGPAAGAVDGATANGTNSDFRDCAAAAAAEGLSGTWDGVKVDPVANGTYAGGGLSVSVTGVAGNRFDWSAGSGHVQVVFVKAGPGANLYSYGAGATGDSGLVSPQPGSISHLLFCTNGTAPAPPPVTQPSGGGGTVPPAGDTGTAPPTSTGDPALPSTTGGAGTGTGTGTAAGTGSAATGTGSAAGSSAGSGGPAGTGSAGAPASGHAQPTPQGETSSPGVLAPPVAKKVATKKATSKRATSRKTTVKKPVAKKKATAPKRSRKTTTIAKTVKASGCVRVRFAKKSFPAGKPATVELLVANAAGPLGKVSIRLRGAGIDRVVRSGRSGTAVVTLRAARAGIVSARVSGARQCSSARIGVTSSVEPTVTG